MDKPLATLDYRIQRLSEQVLALVEIHRWQVEQEIVPRVWIKDILRR